MQEFIDKYYTKDGKLFRKFDNKEIGWKSNNNYLKFDENGKKYYVHRAIFLLVNGYLPELIDHIDRNRLNNLPSNLREGSQLINRINSSLRADNTSSVKGVSFSKSNQKWFASINIHGTRINGGYYEKIEDAIKARSKLEEIYFLPVNKI